MVAIRAARRHLCSGQPAPTNQFRWGVTKTVTTGAQDAGLVRLLESWPTLSEDRKQFILELLGK
jgi:hypothetical protein